MDLKTIKEEDVKERTGFVSKEALLKLKLNDYSMLSTVPAGFIVALAAVTAGNDKVFYLGVS